MDLDTLTNFIPNSLCKLNLTNMDLDTSVVVELAVLVS